MNNIGLTSSIFSKPKYENNRLISKFCITLLSFLIKSSAHIAFFQNIQHQVLLFLKLSASSAFIYFKLLLIFLQKPMLLMFVQDVCDVGSILVPKFLFTSICLLCAYHDRQEAHGFWAAPCCCQGASGIGCHWSIDHRGGWTHFVWFHCSAWCCMVGSHGPGLAWHVSCLISTYALCSQGFGRYSKMILFSLCRMQTPLLSN